jgi:hypothetical protein
LSILMLNDHCDGTHFRAAPGYTLAPLRGADEQRARVVVSRIRDDPFASGRIADVAWPELAQTSPGSPEPLRMGGLGCSMEVRRRRTVTHRFRRYVPMKASRYAVLALATAVVFGLAMSPVMAQSTTPMQSAQDTSQNAMKSSSDAMKSDAMKSSSSDAMKSSSDAMKSDSTKSSTHHKKQHGTTSKPAAASSSGH